MKFDPLHQMFGSSSGAPATSPPSFAPLVAALAAELAETVPAPQRRGFYLALGRRIAAAETLDGVEDASQLAWRVNAFWNAMGWGEAEVGIERDAIVVQHRDAPPAPEHVPSGPWLGMLLAVLEGAYDTWFRRLGSGPSLHTRAEWKGDLVELRHGR
ncbi:hypothetical protein HNO88_001349 [Novosphingobium chloroacetimidivorans]|uniref:Cellulose synthase n=1 Tax=Novosphingobium chloroacetimidivorans TaxID=1428314 RepID=A0A7W7NWC7_9SPHN|nr:hypothetical protein [Novosphingobium chloroacetimidivorans]MBB4858035.1 hypothetical protein [Novosphingobium chloroacetimidivorans]